MRILAIRGRNLASLAGDFELRLDAPPLDGAGLFAITGRTGAGKSTILDALCLALFDQIPRLPAGRGIEVGRADDAPESRLRNNDVRSILRRGAGEGYAEVDFRAVDARRYRARWSVRRARGRAGGRFQSQTMALRDLDSGEDLGGTKTEILDRIQKCLGLTFAQFCRSVLLAQGDFAAFLRADAGERAQLLERITGTWIYGEISKAAHLRAAEEQGQLELVRQRLGDQRPLHREAREALEAELAAARRELEAQQRTQQALHQAQHWYQTLDKLAAERDQAEEQIARAQREQDAAEPRRRQFERIRTLQPLRLPLATLDRAIEALDQSRQDLEQSIAAEQDLQREAEQAGANAATAEAAAVEVRRAREDMAPALQEARRLDTRLQGARAQVARAAAEQESARQVLQEADGEDERLQVEYRREAKTLGQAGDWLAGHAGIEPLAGQWDAWARELDRYTQARGSLNKARAEIQIAERKRSAVEKERRAAEAGFARIDADRAQAAKERTELEDLAAGLDLDRLAALREEHLARREKIDQWRQLAEQARETRNRLQGTRDRIAEENARHAEAVHRLQEIEAEIGPLASALAEAEEAHRRLLLASAGEVEALRAQLREGQPCPVCGAEQHPWAQRAGTVLADLTAAQAARVAVYKQALEGMTAERARKLVESERAARQGLELASELDAEQALLDRTLEVWATCEADRLRPADPFREGLVERHEKALETLHGTLNRISEDEAKARALHSDLRLKSNEIEDLGVRLDAERKRLASLDEQIREVSDALARAETERSRAEATVGQLLNLVAEPLAGIPDWRARLQADSGALIEECQQQVEAWRRRVGQRDRSRQSLQDLAPRLARAQTRRQGAEDELAGRKAVLERESTALAALERERTSILAGRPAEVVDAELNARVARAQEVREQCVATLARMRESLTAAQGVVAAQRLSLQAGEAAVAHARQDLDQRMAGQGVSLDELHEVLELGQDWIDRERQALQALGEDRDRSQALLKERQRRLQEHRTTEPPDLSRSTLSERLPRSGDSLRAAQEDWGRLHGRIHEDDRRRAACRGIQAELERWRTSWELWESLRELIGSADGAKFRNFAQGLTLDLLVAHANRHLTDLARRYLLQPVPGAEMEIQVVDREMGDEVRGIHSLSGGESFLVSLALALGLASLASDRVEVESLFIDEGFGTLDAESLDLAIASLDALYGLGRQVGIISHVGTLVERIGVKVQVSKQGGGRSRIEVVTD